MRHRLATVVSAFAIALAAAIAPAAAQKQGGTLSFYHRDSPPGPSLLEESTVSSVHPFANIYNNLVVFDLAKPKNSQDTIVPDLAKSWSWDASGTKLTFKLNEGVKWHVGRPISANDVQCTWHMHIGKTETDDFRKNPRKAWCFNLEEVTVNGDYEVTFNLKQQQPSFLLLLAAGWSAVYPCHVPQREMRTKPIGTGPFKFAEFKRNDSIRLVRNPDYFRKGKPYRDAIVQIISQGKASIGGAMLPTPEGVWGMPAEFLATLPGYGTDREKNLAEARKIMEGLGYSASKPLAVKVATRNIAEFRDPAVILLDQLKQIHIAGELDVIDTAQWYNRVTRRDYAVGLNLTGSSVDDPDVNLVENFSCKSERNYTQYCNADVEKR